MLKTCPICGAEFETIYSNKKYCSLECKRRHSNNVANTKYIPRSTIKKTCIVCGKEFVPKYTYNKYCSKECMQNHWQHKSGELPLPKTRELTAGGEQFIYRMAKLLSLSR